MSKPLVIVESPAKARTISKFLGDRFQVEASIGHIRDLPGSAADIPKAYKDKKWARTAVDVDNDFKPLYVLTDRGREQVKKLKSLLKDAPELYLATDEDREGEAIAWHLTEVLKPKVPTKRLVFHEITERAIMTSLENARSIDMDLVKAQETRRIIDRLYGYNLSPVLWRKIRPRLSAGRVQSVAVRLIVHREKERMAFVSGSWWSLKASLSASGHQYTGSLFEVDGSRLVVGRDFDSKTGKVKSKGVLLLDETGALALVDALKGAPATISKVEKKGFTERPAAPFTTSKLQQEANRKFRWTAKRTMRVAQTLYENGWITYMRTDSQSLAPEAVKAARTEITRRFGAEFAPAKPRTYKTKSKGAQEAHEAIRPAGEHFKTVADCKKANGADEARLYELIYNRTLACQMADAKGERMTIETVATANSRTGRFRSSGKTYTFAGFRAVYTVSEDAASEAEAVLPPLSAGDPADVQELDASGHSTQPPSRLSEAALVQRLEELGIGRPSTYASIIETVQNRGYVFKKGTALIPTWTAFAVTRLLEDHFETLVDYTFTATLESGLDSIAIGEADPIGYLREFYTGHDAKGLMALIEAAQEQADPRTICSIPVGVMDDQPIVARVGRWGPYLEHNGSTRSLPDDMAPDELTQDEAIRLLVEVPDGPRVLGTDAETGLEVSVQVGRFGPYVQLGEQEKGSKTKPKRSSLLKGMEADSIDFDTAVALLSLPRQLGEDKEGNAIQAFNGRYGPYIKAGKESRSIPETIHLLEINRAQALELLAQPARRGRAAASLLAELGEDPSGRAVVVKSGRFGPYATDGEVNVTLRKGMTPETVKLEDVLPLLEEKHKNPRKKKPTRRKAATKKPAAKKATAKKAPAKKTAAKKPAAKKATAKKAPAKKAPAKRTTARKTSSKTAST